MPSLDNKGTFDTSIKAWLQAMAKAKRIKPGGKLVFVNRKSGAPLQQAPAEQIPNA